MPSAAANASSSATKRARRRWPRTRRSSTRTAARLRRPAAQPQTVMQQERLRALGQMASGIAHDINNAISPIALYTELLLRTRAQICEAGRDQMSAIQRAIEDVAGPSRACVSSTGSANPNISSRPIDLNRIVKQVIELTRARWKRHAQQKRGSVIDLRHRTGRRPARHPGRRERDPRALTNLIFNAVDAMPSGGDADAAHRCADAAQVSSQPALRASRSRDTGIGMDEETRRRCWSLSSPPRASAAPVSASRWCTAWCSATARNSRSTASRAGARHAPDLSGRPRRVRRPRVVRPRRHPKSRLRILVVDDDPHAPAVARRHTRSGWPSGYRGRAAARQASMHSPRPRTRGEAFDRGHHGSGHAACRWT